jgi:uncharacterized membrane protein
LATSTTTSRRRGHPAPDAYAEFDLPRWLPWAATLVAVAGTGVSLYLTLTHYLSSSVPLACSATGTVNCEKVTTSAQSMVFGVFPVAVLGLGYFLVMVALNVPVAWRSRFWWLSPLRLALSVVGMGFALYLIATELLVIDAICLWCTSAHVLSFLLLLLVITGTSRIGLSRY